MLQQNAFLSSPVYAGGRGLNMNSEKDFSLDGADLLRTYSRFSTGSPAFNPGQKEGMPYSPFVLVAVCICFHIA